ncbi:glycosyltransferase [Pontibacter sp. BT731]|uniref:glycosyltransferase n=1 Tax=Pontibacter coccineus TaxID=3063328 RepID=UPI0026E270CD|nr:glycosyltransferase [Pontibacter sp. BT731]MDO6390987.1 glycosyltransferase [Pontibacter sp. BT731]
MKRICFFPGTLSLGGIGKLYINLIEDYSSKGIPVDLFLTKREGVFLDQIPNSVRVFEGKGRASNSILEFIKYLRNEKPCAVISAREYLNIINILCCLTTLNRTKAVVSLHTNQSTEDKYNKDINESGYKNIYFMTLARILYKIPSKIIAVSEGVADDFSYRMGVNRNKIEVIYNPVYKALCPELEVNDSVYEKFIGESNRYIIGVGRLTHQKDFFTLIKSFSLVKKKLNVSLLILGEGPLRDELQDLINQLGLSQSVLLLGYVSNPLYYIKRASLLVVSSKYEGFGNVLVEALGVGTPVVSTDCPSGPSEILERGRYGKLVPVEDAVAMSNAILETLGNKHDSSLLIKRAKDFEVSTIGNQYWSYITS